MMADGKGKGRDPPKEDGGEHLDEPPQESSSLMSRVAASASGLSRSAFAAPNRNEANEITAATLASVGKGQSSRSGGDSTWAESSSAQQPSNQASGSNAFKVEHSEQHIRQSEEDFSSFLDGIESLSSDPSHVVGSSDLGYGALGNDLEDAWARSRATVKSEPPSTVRYRTIAEQEQCDGEEVLALLNDSGKFDIFLEIPEEVEDNYDWGLSTEQLLQLRAMTKDLFPTQEPHTAVSPEHPLNLVPSFEGVNTQRYDSNIDPRVEESYMYFGAPNSATTAKKMWMEQWEGVLTRYTDEVWGGLLPLVKEARKEVEDLRDDSSRTDQPKALRRLGAILGHLQKK